MKNLQKTNSLLNEQAKKIFPLRLTPFEKYMIWDNSKNCPATFTARMIWKGKIDRKRWNRSFEKALGLHPLFRSVVHKKWGKLYWFLNDRLPEIEWTQSRREFEADSMIRLNLAKENGLRILAYEEKNQVTFRMFVHHACSDGAGFVCFYNDWFRFYELDGQTGVNPEDIPSRNFELLPKRNDFVFPPPPETLPFWRLIIEITFQAALWLIGKPLPLNFPKYTTDKNCAADSVGHAKNCSSVSDGSEKSDLSESPVLSAVPQSLRPIDHDSNDRKNFPNQKILYGKLNKKDTIKFLTHIKEKELTINSFFIGRYMNCLADPSVGLVRVRPSGLLRIAIPFNLRWPEMEFLPAANVVSYCFLNRKIKECSKSIEFAKKIANDIFEMRRWNIAAFFVAGINFFASIPGGLFGIVRSPRSLSTAVFSNLGNTDKMFDKRLKRVNEKIALDNENLILDELLFSGPCRNRTSLFFAMYSYGGELHYALRFEADKVTLNRNFIDPIFLDLTE